MRPLEPSSEQDLKDELATAYTLLREALPLAWRQLKAGCVGSA